MLQSNLQQEGIWCFIAIVLFDFSICAVRTPEAVWETAQ